jgi:dipeptidyl aminopeptidase/acylaminoacyl peptidase
LLPKPEPYRYASDWSRDGKYVLFTQRTTTTGEDVWLLPMNGSGEARPVVATQFNEAQAQFSPDGRWIAYTSDDGGAAQVYAMAVAGGPRRQLPVTGGMEPRWRPDGRELFFITPGGMMAAVDVSTQPVWKAGTPKELFRCSPTRTFGWTAATEYDVSNDGSRFVLSKGRMLHVGFNVRLER